MADSHQSIPFAPGGSPRGEHEVLASIALPLSAERLAAVRAIAVGLVAEARRARSSHWLDIQSFLAAFPISEPAGVNLLRLAEALPRTGDGTNQVALLADKIQAIVAGADSDAGGAGRSGEAGDVRDEGGGRDTREAGDAARGWLGSGARRALRLAERVLPDAGAAAAGTARTGVAAGLVRPVARGAVAQLGRQFVFGEAIGQALALAARGRAGAGAPLRYSFDMLGEGARTWEDADLNLSRYREALDAVARRARSGAGMANDGLSIKVSAIHPRYEATHYPRERARLLERLLPLFEAAARADVNLTIDAEESERLALHVDLFAALARMPSLHGWSGLGLVVQAYQLRAPATVDAVLDIARARRERGGAGIAVRLVKGAYWDAEIKRAQELGLAGYPVFTEKAGTDRSYIACADRLLAGADVAFPQFATHNAVTIAVLLELARQRSVGADRFELQRLHGMGEAVHAVSAPAWQRATGAPPPACRVYAPVGDQSQLLAYLIRRMLENGASTSFVRRLADASIDERAVVDAELAPLLEPLPDAARRHRIPRPPQLYGDGRRNALGLDPQDPYTIARMTAAVQAAFRRGGEGGAAPEGAIRSPADRSRVVGTVREADARDAVAAVARANAAFEGWQRQPVEARAVPLERWADALEADLDTLVGLCVAEAGKTIADAIADVREAVDFCRYYALEARRLMAAPIALPGPTGERNELSLAGRGVFVCISPWNFPVAIFVGQVAAALVTGNTVVAKPAERTPLAALHAAALALRAGVPRDVLQVVPGEGAVVGAALVAAAGIAGVVFTGSNATAKSIQRSLCEHHAAILPFVAETGGQNAMIVDSTALPEQVVDAVMQSAFRSAGQRCSALRVLAVQHEIADRIVAMVEGAMRTLAVGDPADPATDVGPVIDEAARAGLESHVETMRARGRVLARLALTPECERGSFVAPTMLRIDDVAELDREHFGPILHVLRFPIDRLDELVDGINRLGFGLTLGVHTRIDARAEHVRRRARIGNVYVNRNIIGAVVGAQPFGGDGLSGTGPKAGGPHYLLRFVTERTWTVNTAAAGGDLALLAG